MKTLRYLNQFTNNVLLTLLLLHNVTQPFTYNSLKIYTCDFYDSWIWVLNGFGREEDLLDDVAEVFAVKEEGPFVHHFDVSLKG